MSQPTFKKPSRPYRLKPTSSIRHKPTLKPVQKESTELEIGSLSEAAELAADISLEDSDTSEQSSHIESSDLSSSEISAQSKDEKISEEQIIVSLEKSKEIIKKKLANTYRVPPGGGRFYRREEKEGIVFLSHIPFGFFEKQIKRFFSQFGRIKRLNLIRSKKTGKSKGYCYIQFSDPIVAKIVADTMNGYIIFSHLLKCELVPPGNYSPSFWEEYQKPLVSPAILHSMGLIVKKSDTTELKREKRLLEKDKVRKRKMAQLGINYSLPERQFNYLPKKKARRKREKVTQEDTQQQNENPEDGEIIQQEESVTET